jgi:hypothetical protein
MPDEPTAPDLAQTAREAFAAATAADLDGVTAGLAPDAEARVAHVLEAVDGKVVRDTAYADIHEGRAAAERLARERE